MAQPEALARRLDMLQPALEAALEMIGEDTGLDDLLSLLVSSVQGLAEEVQGQKAAVAAAVESCEASAAAAARDSTAAAIAMSEATKLVATTTQRSAGSFSELAGKKWSEDEEAVNTPVRPTATTADPAPTPEAPGEAAPSASAPSLAPAAFLPTGSGVPAAVSGEAALADAPLGEEEAAEQMAEILENAHLAASEIILLLDDPPPALGEPRSGEEELRSGVAANQIDDYSTAATWCVACPTASSPASPHSSPCPPHHTSLGGTWQVRGVAPQEATHLHTPLDR